MNDIPLVSTDSVNDSDSNSCLVKEPDLNDAVVESLGIAGT